MDLFFYMMIAALGIIAAGSKLPDYAEKLGPRLGLSSGLVGIFLVAGVTSLPEFVSIIGTLFFLPQPQPNLLMGNLFGSNLFNLTLFVFLEFLTVKSIFSGLRENHRLTLRWGVIVNALALVGLIIGPVSSFFNIWSFLLFILYILSAWSIGKDSKKEKKLPPLDASLASAPSEPGKEETTFSIAFRFFLASLVIVICGLWLCKTLDNISVRYGLGRTFLGNLFLAGSTSLPELVVSYAAIRMGMKEISIGNILGSNLMNLSFIFLGEVFIGFRMDFFQGASPAHRVTLLCVLLGYALLFFSGGKEDDTSIFQKRFMGLSLPSLGLLILFCIANAYAFFFV